MRGTFYGIEIGRTGLSTSQFGLDTTGHNIANTDTQGYTRQRIVQTAYDPYSSIGRFAPMPGHALVGGGTRIKILDQIRSAYLDRRFRTENTTHAYWETRTQSLSYVESFFDNVNEKTSINYSMSEFFRSMEILAQDPVSGAPRTLMQTTAMDLVQQMRMIHQGLVDLQESENRSVQTKTETINLMTQDIVELNKAIYVFEVTGMIANDLRDKRNLLVDQLSELIDIEYREYPDPQNPNHDLFRLWINDGNSNGWKEPPEGVMLVDHDEYKMLGTKRMPNPVAELASATTDPLNPAYDALDPNHQFDVWNVYYIVGWDHANDTVRFGDAINFDERSGGVSGGQIKAHIDVRDGTGIREVVVGTDTYTEWDADSTSRGIPYYIEMMNDLARSLVKEINDIHIQGWSDNPLYSESGIFFFNEELSWTTWVDNTNGDRYEWNEDDSRWEGAGGYIFQDPDTGQFMFNDGVEDTPLDFADFTRDLGANISLITAANIDLSAKIKEDPFNIAASSRKISRAASTNPEETQRHNNEVIWDLYRLFSRTNIEVMRADGLPRSIGSFDDYGTVIRFNLGNTLHTAKQTGETCRLLKLSAENQRTAISGVSLDEEMVGIVKYQHAYNGASRVITAMDEALDRLINGTGRVGL